MARAIEIEFGDGRKLKFCPGPSYEAKRIVSAEWEDSSAAAADRDPWAHRSAGMRCRTCMWWQEKVPTGGYHGDPLHRKVIGRCRRHAPTMQGFPVVFDRDWCGDHKLDEAKA